MKTDCVRLIDYALTRGIFAPTIYSQAGRADERLVSLTQTLLQRCRTAQHWVIDNVAQYLFETSEQEYWAVNDFPSLAPPAPLVWMEYLQPSTIRSKELGPRQMSRHDLRGAAVLIETAPIEDGSERASKLTGISVEAQRQGAVRWWQTMTSFTQAGRHHDERLFWELPLVSWFLNAEGQVWMPNNQPLLRLPLLDAPAVAKYDPDNELIAVPTACHVAALALSFLSCRGTVERIHAPRPRFSAAYLRRHGHSLTRFRTMETESARRILETDVRAVGLKRALHICQGHFKDYRYGGGLFGKHHDVFWFEAHLRGGDE